MLFPSLLSLLLSWDLSLSLGCGLWLKKSCSHWSSDGNQDTAGLLQMFYTWSPHAFFSWIFKVPTLRSCLLRLHQRCRALTAAVGTFCRSPLSQTGFPVTSTVTSPPVKETARQLPKCWWLVLIILDSLHFHKYLLGWRRNMDSWAGGVLFVNKIMK